MNSRGSRSAPKSSERISTEERNTRLKAAIDAYSEMAYGSDTDSELANSRSGSIKRYLGTNINPAPVGRSQVRDRTTFEVIEWTKPSLLRIFTGGDEICKFDPVGPEDEDLAEQESDYINHVITQRNNWFSICSDLVNDGLLSKNGYLHAYWDDSVATESETYEDLTDDSFALLVQDKDLEVVAHSERPHDEQNEVNAAAYQRAMQQYQQAMQQQAMQAQIQGAPFQPQPPPEPPQPAYLHDVELRRTKTNGCVKLCALAPERCLIDSNTPSHTLEGCNYFEYYDYKTIGKLRAEGLEVPDGISDEDGTFETEEDLARNRYSEEYLRQDSQVDRASRRVKVRYIWLRHDYNGDGIDEFQYVVRIGSELLYRKECEDLPVASWSPIPMAHRHVGMSLADSVEDIEDISTNITRQAIDNLNLSNTPRIAVSDRVNMPDLLDVRVGGVVRVEGQPPQEMMPLVVPNTFPDAVQALTFFDQRRQNRTGINAYFQGTDANSLNKTASGISQLTNSAAQRVESIGRNLASCIERAFLIVHRLILQHGHQPDVVKLRNRWVAIDPAQWRKRTDVRISVGLGTGNKDSLMASLMQMFQVQMASAQAGVVQPQNLYATVLEISKAAGFANPGKFVTDPSTQPPQQPQPPPQVLVEQLKQQGDAQRIQFEAQNEKEKLAIENQLAERNAQREMEVEMAKVRLELEFKERMEQIRIASEREIKLFEIAADTIARQAEAQMKAAQEGEDGARNEAREDSRDQATMSVITAMAEQISKMAEAMAQPKAIQVTRDQHGRVSGAQQVLQ